MGQRSHSWVFYNIFNVIVKEKASPKNGAGQRTSARAGRPSGSAGGGIPRAAGLAADGRRLEAPNRAGAEGTHRDGTDRGAGWSPRLARSRSGGCRDEENWAGRAHVYAGPFRSQSVGQRVLYNTASGGERREADGSSCGLRRPPGDRLHPSPGPGVCQAPIPPADPLIVRGRTYFLALRVFLAFLGFLTAEHPHVLHMASSGQP